MPSNLLESLNPIQKEAVLHFESPLLIVAGAGSGKTKVITHKIAYMIQEKDMSPFRILGVTFTNKAANEMKERVAKLTGFEPRQFPISTFHSLGLRILRESGSTAGFDSDWQVMNDSEQRQLLDRIIKENYSFYTNDMRDDVRKKINLAKMNLSYPNNREELFERGFSQEEVSIFSMYYERQQKVKRWDYEDLVSLPTRLLQHNEEIREKYRNRFDYIVVDEFQDTNPNQYELVKLLARQHQQITVVGDDDQAIYSWRGASIRFLFDYENDFRDVRTIKLEQNYRSTKPILDFANQLITRNKLRKGKSMWTQNKGGNPVYLLHTASKEGEAAKVAELIYHLIMEEPDLLPVAVLYRINSQSLAFETEFTRRNIRFKILKGQPFFERKEIKDSMALLKLAYNPDDDISFVRLIDMLPLGIGAKTLEQISAKAGEEGTSLFSALRDHFPDRYNAKESFKKIMELHHSFEDRGVSEILTILLNYTRYRPNLEERGEQDRLMNIEELVNFIKDWEQSAGDRNFGSLLDRMSLDSDIGEKGDQSNTHVFLLTMHNAKGLEFNTVVTAGVNSTYLPFFMRKEASELEEERRLMYVAVTRPIKQLILSVGSHKPSPFLRDVEYTQFRNLYSVEEFIDELSPRPEIPNEEAAAEDETFIQHPFFGKGRVRKKIDHEKILVDFENKGEKVIDTSIVAVTFL